MRLLAAFFLSLGAFAQPDSRASEIEAERQKKADSLKPEALSKGEAILHKANDMRLIERTTEGIAGLHIVLGNMVTGSGFALGPEYIRRDLKDGNIVFRTAVRASTKHYLLGDAQLTFPKLFGGLAYADLYTAYHSFTDLHYYGSGPDTGTGNRGHYLKETGEYVGRFGINVFPRFQIGGAGAFLKVNTGPGTQQPPEFSIEQRYTPQEAIGVDRQAHYARAALYAQYDWRDNPGGLAKKGGFYNLRLVYNKDVRYDTYSFRQLDAEIQQYIPFFNERRVFAFRGRTELTYPNAGQQQVPFYMQPVLGGSDDLRGYRNFRFYGDNLILLNGEYRWEIFSGLDMAFFADAGKVFQRHAEFNFKDLESAVGFGFRANVRNTVFLRIDVGFSHEGWRIWFKFNDVFKRGIFRL
jgi:hypothetical protein